jgi:hypothetical protein
MDEQTLYATIHDQMRLEGYNISFFDIARIIELYHEILYGINEMEGTRDDG